MAAGRFTGVENGHPGARRAQASATVTRMGQDRPRAWFARRANRARPKATPMVGCLRIGMACSSRSGDSRSTPPICITVFALGREYGTLAAGQGAVAWFWGWAALRAAGFSLLAVVGAKKIWNCYANKWSCDWVSGDKHLDSMHRQHPLRIPWSPRG